METNAAIVVPREENELEVFCSTQHPTEIQKLIAHVLNIYLNRVNVRVKRIGGGFGGKESRATLLAIPVALAAHRCVYKFISIKIHINTMQSKRAMKSLHSPYSTQHCNNNVAATFEINTIATKKILKQKSHCSKSDKN